MGEEEKTTLKQACSSSEELHSYLCQKANNHHCYKVYSTLSRVDYWMKERALFLSTGENWNDTDDRNSFNSDSFDYVNFGICFSFSKSENIAMWMLYGGMEHQGMMINFGKKQIQEIIRQEQPIEFGNWVNNRFEKKMSISKEFLDIYMIDVLYVSESVDKNGYDIKRSTETDKNIQRQIVDELNGVKKAYPWNYENECRLIIKVPRKHLVEKVTSARLPVGNVFEVLQKEHRIFTAPNYKEERQFSNSNLFGKIDWDLCKQCSPRG